MDRLLNIYRLGIKELRSLWSDKILLVVILWVFTGGIYVVAMAASKNCTMRPSPWLTRMLPHFRCA